MQKNYEVRRATFKDVEWIVDLSARVQIALNARGSLQHIGPLSYASVETTIKAGYGYILEVEGLRVGSMLLDLLTEPHFVIHTLTKLSQFPAPHWYLHALMLDPLVQGQGLGLIFLERVRQLVLTKGGTIILDCWAGNLKLCAFYQQAGFTFHGNVPENDYEVSVFSFSLANA